MRRFLTPRPGGFKASDIAAGRRSGLLSRLPWRPEAGGLPSSFVGPVSWPPVYAAKADMAHAAVDHLRMPGRRSVAPAIIGRAEKGAALDHLARNPHLGLGRIVAGLDRPAARICTRDRRPAAGGGVIRGVALAEPVRGPLPDISRHVAEAIAIGRKCADRRGTVGPRGLQILPGELTPPD